MQQELWLRARSQVFASLKAVCAMRAAASHPHPLPLPPPPPPPPLPPLSEHELRHALSNTDDSGQDHVSNSLRPSQFRGRTSNSTFHNNHQEDTEKTNVGEFPWIPHNPVKASRRHQELHRELLMAHRKGLAVCCRPELQMVMERRKREQTQREEGEQCRSPLEQVLIKRQQKQEEVMKEKEDEEKIHHEIQLMEFIRVRSNLKKVHSALQKSTTS